MLSASELDQLARDFERDGFVNGGQLLDRDETVELQSELERYADTLFRGRSHDIRQPPYAGNLSQTPGEAHFQIAGLWQVSEPFRRLIAKPRLAEIAAHLTRSSSIQLWCDTIQYKPPRDGAPFHWHQDAPYHLSVGPPERLIGAWVALDDADEESGCMWMVPGSYRWGQQEPHLWRFRQTVSELSNFANLSPPVGLEEAERHWQSPVPRPVRAGEVHFHHALTWHGSPANRSERNRRAYSMFLMPEGIRVTATPDHRIPIPEGGLMSEAGQEFPFLYPRAGA